MTAYYSKKNRNKNVNIIDINDVKVRIVPKQNLRLMAVYSYCNNNGSMNDIIKSLSNNLIEPSTIHRWEVNYIRHYLVNDYDDIVSNFDCKSSSYVAFKKAVLFKIASYYPYLHDECMRQINKLDSNVNIIDSIVFNNG